MIIRLFLLIVRPLFEIGASLFVFVGVGIGGGAMTASVEAIGWPILWLFFWGAYAAVFWLLFRESERSRLMFDVWLGAGTAAIYVTTQSAWHMWPFEIESVSGENWFWPPGGELNLVLQPYLHAAFWWAGRAGVRWLRRRFGIDE